MSFQKGGIVSFSDRVLWLVGEIPLGKVASYGQIALYAGNARAARAVGNTLRVKGAATPWHRVVNSTGRISFKGDTIRAENQKELLIEEGIIFSEKGIDFQVFRWSPELFYWAVE